MHREILTALLLPGWSARGRRRRLAIGALILGTLPIGGVAIYALASGRNPVALGLDGGFLGVVLVAAVLALVVRAAAVVEIWDSAGRPVPPDRRSTVALTFAVVALSVGAISVIRVGQARSSIAPSFTGSGGSALYDPETVDEIEASADSGETTDTASLGPVTATADAPEPKPPLSGSAVVATTPSTTSTTLPPLPSRPDSGVDASMLADVTTVMLLGADSGPDRQGLRTDTMMLFSVHQPSGRAALVSIPRDLRRLLFPPGSALERRHPYGFDGIANAVYPVASRQSLRDSYAVDGVRPGVVAIAQALGYSFDVTIDDYVLVDMAGFIDLIDALGGVTIDVRKEIPMPGNVPNAPTQYPDTIGPGTIQMDGTTALGYVRSRYADNDFRRTERQRRLLAALAQQISIGDVIASFPDLADAVGGTLRTSLSPDELAETLEIIGGETAIVESVGLVPPLLDIRRPDFDRAAKAVGAVHVALVTGQPSGL